jgi:hypothetical protein
MEQIGRMYFHRERHMEESYIGEKLISQLLPTLFEFRGMENIGRMDFLTAHIEMDLLRNRLYFDHTFFI